MQNQQGKYGARVFKVSAATLLIRQTIRRGNDANARYVCDGQKECHVRIKDNSAIAKGIRDAIEGTLPPGKSKTNR